MPSRHGSSCSTKGQDSASDLLYLYHHHYVIVASLCERVWSHSLGKVFVFCCISYRISSEYAMARVCLSSGFCKVRENRATAWLQRSMSKQAPVCIVIEAGSLLHPSPPQKTFVLKPFPPHSVAHTSSRLSASEGGIAQHLNSNSMWLEKTPSPANPGWALLC